MSFHRCRLLVAREQAIGRHRLLLPAPRRAGVLQALIADTGSLSAARSAPPRLTEDPFSNRLPGRSADWPTASRADYASRRCLVKREGSRVARPAAPRACRRRANGRAVAEGRQQQGSNTEVSSSQPARPEVPAANGGAGAARGEHVVRAFAGRPGSDPRALRASADPVEPAATIDPGTRARRISSRS